MKEELDPLVFIGVPLVFIGFPLVFIGVLLVFIGVPLVWCFRLDPKNQWFQYNTSFVTTMNHFFWEET